MELTIFRRPPKYDNLDRAGQGALPKHTKNTLKDVPCQLFIQIILVTLVSVNPFRLNPVEAQSIYTQSDLVTLVSVNPSRLNPI